MSSEIVETPKVVEPIPTLEEWTAAGYPPDKYEGRFANSVAPVAVPHTVPDVLPHPSTGGVMGANGLWSHPVVAEEVAEPSSIFNPINKDEEAKEDNPPVNPSPVNNTTSDSPPVRTVPSTMGDKNAS